tara:strand:+ start:755 stop:1012 length:258 start_codon:yes stop_codon:yes gene_type:complete
MGFFNGFFNSETALKTLSISETKPPIVFLAEAAAFNAVKAPVAIVTGSILFLRKIKKQATQNGLEGAFWITCSNLTCRNLTGQQV